MDSETLKCQDAKKGKKTKEMSKTKLKILQKREVCLAYYPFLAFS
jgi:hypothetical protein